MAPQKTKEDMVPAVAFKGKSKLLHQVPKEDATRLTKKNTTTALVGLPSSFKIFAEPLPPPAPSVKLGRLQPHAHSLYSNATSKSSLNGGTRVGSASGSQSGNENLEKNKGKKDCSVKANIARKALADISNFKGSFTGLQMHNKSKLLSKNYSILDFYELRSISEELCFFRNSAVGTQSGSRSSRKPFTAVARNNVTQASGNHHTAKKVADKDRRIASSNDLGTKTRGSKFVSTSRKSHGIYPPRIRKSFPVTEQVKRVPPSEKKESTESCEKRREKYGFQVNSKAGRNVSSRVHNSQSHLWKVRASDGYMDIEWNEQCPHTIVLNLAPRGLRGQHNSGFGTASRRSVKVERTLNSKGFQSFNKPLARSVAFSRTEEKAKCSSTEHASVILSRESAQQDVSSFSKYHSDRTVADNVASRKPDRRKSFTSLLMSQSKDDLPNIYDNQNHLEVTEYVDDIYQYYWVLEAQNQPSKRYMDIQSEIVPQMRGILINWLIEVHLKFDLMQETLFLMVTLFDQFLSLVIIKKNKMQLVGLTALLLASKYEDFWHPRVTDLLGVSADSYSRDEMLKMENTFLKALKFRLNAPTPYVFMLRVLKAAQSDKMFEHLAFYLIELCLVEHEALKYKPSLLCASAIYLARCTLKITPTWTPLLEKHSRYRESQIRHCAEMILKFHKAAKKTLLKVTHEKYMRLDFSKVAAINPVEVLPRCSH